MLSELQQKKLFGVNYGIISTPKFVRRKLRQQMTLPDPTRPDATRPGPTRPGPTRPDLYVTKFTKTIKIIKVREEIN